MKKILCKYLSIVLSICIFLQMSPANIINVMAANETVLNIANGFITITDNSYVQKNDQGVVVASGTALNNELIITGSQNKGYNIIVGGTNLPTIHFKDITTNGEISGAVYGNINLVFEGTCTFDRLFKNTAYDNSYFFCYNLNLIGISGSKVNVSNNTVYSCSNDTLIYNMNMNGTIEAIGRMITIRDSNITVFGGAGKHILNIYNSNFGTLSVGALHAVYLEGVTNSKGRISDSYDSYNLTIQNCDIKLEYPVILRKNQNARIINSRIEFYNESGTSILVEKDTIMNIVGSTIKKDKNNNYRDISADYYWGARVYVTDSSLDIGSALFYDIATDQTFNICDEAGEVIYLNKLKVPNAINSKLSVNIDNRSAVPLYTDSQGYLYLYLADGQHTVIVDNNGTKYTKTFIGATTDDKNMDDNDKGVMDAFNQTSLITTPFISSNIQYSFDNNNWSNATTDETGKFAIIIPNNETKIYIKQSTNNAIKYADITNGIVGTFKDYSVPVDVSELIEQINDLTVQITTLQDQLTDANSYNTELQGTIAGLETEITDLNGQVAILLTMNAELEDDLEQEQEDKEAMNTTISNLNNQINQLNQNIQIREGQLQQALNELITLGNTVNSLNSEIVNLHSQIIILNHELQSLEEVNQQLHEQIFTLQNNILDFEVSILDLQTSLDDANNTSLVLIEILNSTNDELTSVNILLTSIKIELGVSSDDEIIPMIQLLTSGNLSTAGNSLLITGGDEQDMTDDGMEEQILIDEDISTK